MEAVVEEPDTNKTKTRVLTKKDLELESVTEILKKCLKGLDQFCVDVYQENRCKK